MVCDKPDLLGFWSAVAGLLSAGFLAYPLFFLLRLRDALETLEAPAPGADEKTRLAYADAAEALRAEYRRKRRFPTRMAITGVIFLALASLLLVAQGACIL